MVRRQTGPGPERLVTVSGQMWTGIVGSSNLGISSACGPSVSTPLSNHFTFLEYVQRPEESPHVHRIDTLTVRTATTKIPNTWRTFPIHGLMVKPKTRRGMAIGNGASPGQHTAGCVAGVARPGERSLGNSRSARSPVVGQGAGYCGIPFSAKQHPLEKLVVSSLICEITAMFTEQY